MCRERIGEFGGRASGDGVSSMSHALIVRRHRGLPLRVGFISRWDVADRSAQSGMPASIWDGLQRAGVDLVHLRPVHRVGGP